MYAGQIREFLSLMGDMVAGYDSRTETERRIDREMINELWYAGSVNRYSDSFDEPHVGDLRIRFQGNGWSDMLKQTAKYGNEYLKADRSIGETV